MDDNAPGFNEADVRHKTRRILQLMNQYSLMEIEFEDKETDDMLKLRRDSQESSPPLLEGRSNLLPGEVRASTVGTLEWNCEEGDSVNRGEVVAKIHKQDESIPVKAPQGGELTDCTKKDAVQFGDTVARVLSEATVDDEDEES